MNDYLMNHQRSISHCTDLIRQISNPCYGGRRGIDSVLGQKWEFQYPCTPSVPYLVPYRRVPYCTAPTSILRIQGDQHGSGQEAKTWHIHISPISYGCTIDR